VNRLYVPISKPQDWQALLAEPDKHWKAGYSAKALAQCWMEADGFPQSVKNAFSSSGIKVLENIELLLAIPELKVSLPGGARPSQNDLFVLARGGGDLIVIMVEGKVAEPFGPTLGEWLENASDGKKRRLAYLEAELGLPSPVPPTIRYQLLHRAASAVIEARRFNARHAMMLVHSFSETDEWFEDYVAFAALYGAKAATGMVKFVKAIDENALYLGWVKGGVNMTGLQSALICKNREPSLQIFCSFWPDRTLTSLSRLLGQVITRDKSPFSIPYN
jgi:hypothetical protein